MDSVFQRIYNNENRINTVLSDLREKGKRVVLYGAGHCGYEAFMVMNEYNIPILAICDDRRIGEQFENWTISRIEDIRGADDVCIFITCGYNRKMQEKLRELGLIEYYCDIDFGRYDHIKDNYSFFVDNSEEITAAYNLLSDDKSRDIFIRIINFRISRDNTFLSGIMDVDNQYFPSESRLQYSLFEKHCFLDLGAFNGDTIDGFINYTNGKYKKIIAVEADKKNFISLKENTIPVDHIEYHNLGAYSKKTALKFKTDAGTNSFITDDGLSDDLLNSGFESIEVDKVDSIINNQEITVIKMDIEGAEFDAIEGAKDTIRDNTPILAICVYHLTEDLFRIILEIEKIMKGKYEYYLRHYSPTIIETVLYAIPKEEIGHVKMKCL